MRGVETRPAEMLDAFEIYYIFGPDRALAATSQTFFFFRISSKLVKNITKRSYLFFFRLELIIQKILLVLQIFQIFIINLNKIILIH